MIRIGLTLGAALAVAWIGGGCAQPADCAPSTNTELSPVSASDSVYVGIGDPYSVGSLSVRRHELDACEFDNAVPLLVLAPEAPGDYPVVVFQHGFVTRNEAYGEMLSHLASHGFVVVAPQMYEPGLSALLGRPTAIDEAQQAAELLSWLPRGLATALGYAPATATLGLAGHSRGGYVAWLVLAGDPSRAQAIAGVDPVGGTRDSSGNQTPPQLDLSDISVPTLVLGMGLSGDCAPAGANHNFFYDASRSPAWHAVLPDAGHADMLDESTAAAAVNVCPGGPDRDAIRRATAGLLVAFFRGSLQGDASAYDSLSDAAGAPVTLEVESK